MRVSEALVCVAWLVALPAGQAPVYPFGVRVIPCRLSKEHKDLRPYLNDSPSSGAGRTEAREAAGVSSGEEADR